MGQEESKRPERKEPTEQVDRLAHGVIGAAIEVHRVLGPGFLESVYEEAPCAELELRGMAFRRQVPVAVDYKGEYKLDLLVGDALIIELKAVDVVLPIHEAQVLSYLKATRCPLALIINFNVPVLRDGIRRRVLS